MIIWCGQIVSTIGSAMTRFALTIWVWQLTGEATSIALFSFFYQLPLIFVSLFAGVIVDRYRRKYLIILGDTSAIVCTIFIALLYSTNNLQIWHLYFLVSLAGCFGHIQNLAYSASIPLMVPQQHYTRASSLSTLVGHASAIFSPALAGILYPLIGLLGIMMIDIATFAVATVIILLLPIPQPLEIESTNKDGETIWQKLAFGFQYILSRPSLLAITVTFSCFWFAQQIGETLYQPMILARTNGNTEILGAVMTAAGVGGVIGGLCLSIWGGFKRRVYGILIGFIGTGLSQIILGINQIPFIWIGASFCSSVNLPLLFSSNNAIWYSKVESNCQGRVFAADHTIGMIIGSVASLTAGPLADIIFEPAMKPGGILASVFSPIFGTGTGSGMALLYVITSILIVFVGISGFAWRSLRDVEDILPDQHHSI
jgi:MFS transporter, DHA3 family, macrolide efflux protein